MENKQTDLAVPQGSNALMDIINRAATDPVFDVAKLDQLLAVKERWEKDEARKAFVAALNAFKADPPEIFKNKTVSYKDTKYKHASLDNVSIVIGTALARHGLAHRWSVDQDATTGRIKVTCILMHNAGHSESVSLTSSADQSGSKNSIQAIGSTVTYLERYTLLSVTGMAVQDDDDGAAAAPKPAPIAAPTDSADPIVIKPGVVKKRGEEFVIPNEDDKIEYHTPDEEVAKYAKQMNKLNGTMRLLFSYKNGKRYIDSVDRS